MHRKQFLKNSVKGVVLTTLLPSLAFCTTNGQQKTIPGNYQLNSNFEPDTDIELTATPSKLQLFPGNQTEIYSYRSKKGIYVYHCHNLEHEDMGMMRNYEVV